MLEYKLIRSKRRKTLGLQVNQGQITVRAPHYVTTAFIDSFIEQKSVWLRTKLAEHSARPSCFDFTQGSQLFFLGEPLSLNISLAKHASVFIASCVQNDTDLIQALEPINNNSTDNNPLACNTSLRQLNVVISDRVNNKLTTPFAIAKQVKKQLEVYFKQEAEQLIFERLEQLTKQTALIPKQVNIRQYKARWGSCNNRGEVSFNYLLMMTPIFVIDYVIIHELCHLTYLNHSTDFWLLVEKHCPAYTEAKDWLNNHHTELIWQLPI
ncbi:SprT family zinc-dependent metalloprotease [Colwellia sp. E2M01]|uniref:M48 family metallopeptidase n=1 Tax=Colwellia sp. E2M01 TaxID=2841561 RepID=UPI001C0A3DB7|nr:SprT family zinc-dependent metalloprotease [Colwellia sp. E2M01]MBU2872039.1 M48 family metallopeptidase [Colwellia sp. E2M01]